MVERILTAQTCHLFGREEANKTEKQILEAQVVSNIIFILYVDFIYKRQVKAVSKG